MNEVNVTKEPGTSSVATESTHGGRSEWTYRPKADIFETAEELELLVDLPGVAGENVDVDFRDGTLTIYARVEGRQPEETKFLRREYGVGDFHRSFTVSEAIDASKITAKYEMGVLTLTLPKVEAVKPHKIEVARG
jgi:HSP20 family protein